MRKLVITENLTLDGSIEMLDDWFDPQLNDDDLLEESHRQDAEADALLLGRQTFEDFRRYWPEQTDDHTGSISLAHLMIGAGVVDEYRMFVYPVVQGRGRPLFSVGTRRRLRLLGEPKSFPSGIVLLRYG
jgi:dihydrofolate reductase